MQPSTRPPSARGRCRHRIPGLAGTAPGTATDRGITQTPSLKMQPRDISQGDAGLCAPGQGCHQLTGLSHRDPLLLHPTPTAPLGHRSPQLRGHFHPHPTAPNPAPFSFLLSSF